VPDMSPTKTSFRRSFSSGTDQLSEDIFESGPFSSDAPPAVMREGLPPSYRMRHDTHYVDKLTSKASARPVRLLAIKDIKGADDKVGYSSELGPLTRSIHEHGVLQPLLVRIRKGRYELVAGAKRLKAAAAAGITEVPCLVHEADDVQARKLAEATKLGIVRGPVGVHRGRAAAAIPSPAVQELCHNLQTIISCLQMVSDPERSLRERVVIELMQAEAQRMARLVQGLNVLSEVHRLSCTELNAHTLLQRVVSMLDPERRLLGVQISLGVGESSSTLRGDEQLLSVALSGAIGSMMELFRNTDGGSLEVSWKNSASRGQFIISQGTITLPTIFYSRLFDQNWQDRPGGYPAAVGLISAKRVAELHGGSLDIDSGKQGGCLLRIELPLAR
jgi:signal transduction histidine kinase